VPSASNPITPPPAAAFLYPTLPQVNNYDELPPPYAANPNIEVSDAKS